MRIMDERYCCAECGTELIPGSFNPANDLCVDCETKRNPRAYSKACYYNHHTKKQRKYWGRGKKK
jgi:hypothetical protein